MSGELHTMRGKIKWYNQYHGFGVIIGADKELYFIHWTNIKDKYVDYYFSLSKDVEVSFKQSRYKRKELGICDATDIEIY